MVAGVALHAQSLPAQAPPAGAPNDQAAATTPETKPPDQNKAVDGTDLSDLPAPVDPNSFRIGAEDVIEVRVWGMPQLTSRGQVLPNGTVYVSLLKDVQAAGLTPRELEKKLTSEFEKVVVNPLVSVVVLAVRSQFYYLAGEGIRNGKFPLVTPLRVMDAITIAGGLGQWANKKKIRIVRGSETHYFNYNDVSKGKKLDQNIYIQSGDYIYVD